MDRLLQYCCRETGYEEPVIDSVVKSFLEGIAEELAAGNTVDLGETLGVFRVKPRAGNVQEGSPRTPKTPGYRVVFREGNGLKRRLKEESARTGTGRKVSQEGLLEAIGRLTGCCYLSDLRRPGMLSRIRRAVGKLDPRQYSLWEWNDAVCYLTGRDLRFESREEAAGFLREL